MEKKKDIVVEYEAAAASHGGAKNSKEANRAADRIAAAYRELRASESRDLLLPLLGHENPSVRAWAASHALEFAPERGAAVLEDLANGRPGPIRASATFTLREWRAGRLKFT